MPPHAQRLRLLLALFWLVVAATSEAPLARRNLGTGMSSVATIGGSARAVADLSRTAVASSDAPDPASDRRLLRPAAQPFGLVTNLAYASPDDADLGLLRDSGAQWAREAIRWDRAGGVDGPFSFSQPQSILRAIAADGLKVLGVLSHPPPEWVPGRPAGFVPAPFGPNAADQWTGFVDAAGRAVSGNVDAWEIWDRPNDSGTWKPRPQADDYLVLLGASHGALATRDPGARIVLGATAGVEEYFSDGITTRVGGVHWLEALLERDAAALVNAVAVQPLADTPEGAADDVRRLADSLRERPDAEGLEIWVTEIGWPLEDLALTAHLTGWTAEEMQAAYLVRTYATLLATPRVARVFWRGMEDRGAEGDFALLSSDGSPRPAYHAYQTIATWLDGATVHDDSRVSAPFVSTSPASESVELRFSRQDDEVIVVWFRDGGGTLRDVMVSDLPAGAIEIVAIDGMRTTTASTDGRLTVMASEAPVLLVVSRGDAPLASPPSLSIQLADVRVDPEALRRGVRRVGSSLRLWAQDASASPTVTGAPSPSAAVQQLLAALTEGDAERCAAPFAPAARLAGQAVCRGLFALLSANGISWDASALTVRLVRASPTTATVRVRGRMGVSHDRGDESVAGSIPIDVTLRLHNAGEGWVVSGVG